MFETKIEISGIEEAKKMLSKDLFKKILRKAAFNTAYDAKKDLVREMTEVFDRPTPFILRSVTVRSEGWSVWNPTATGASDLSVIIGIEVPPMGGKAGGTDPADILRPHIEGGTRETKPSEKRFREYWVPGQGARLNKYGGISGGQITQILATLGKFEEVGYLMNVTPRSRARTSKKARNYFVVGWNNKGLRAGVWERTSSGRVKPILIFIKKPSYHRRLKFYEVLGKSILKNIHRRFNEAFDELLRVSPQ